MPDVRTSGVDEESESLSWRPLSTADLSLLANWLAEPQVKRWWNHETSAAAIERDFGPALRGEEPGETLVVLLGERQVGLLQRYRIGDYPEYVEEFAGLADIPAGAVSVDYLIGEATLRGRGLGAQIIAHAVARTWVDYGDASAVIVPVVAANTASWRALEKAGLRRIAEGNLTPDNPIDDPLHYVYRADRPGRPY